MSEFLGSPSVCYKQTSLHRRGRRGCDRMVVGFTTTYAVSAYHHSSCELESCLWWGVLDRTLCDKVYWWIAAGLVFSFLNKTEILLVVALNTTALILLRASFLGPHQIVISKLHYVRSGLSWSCLVVGFTTTYMQSVPITPNVSLDPTHGVLYSIQYNVIKFVSDFRQVAGFLAHLAFRPRELLSSLFVCRPSANISHFNLLLRNHWANCNQTWWNGPWMAPFQNCVRWSRLPTKKAAKLKIKKRGDEILIVHCCFSVSQNELKF